MKLRKMCTFLIIFCLIVYRNPQRLLHARLWAEDGLVFFENAFETPINQNILKQNLGYLQVLQRFFTELSIVNNRYEAAPFFMNFWAIVIAAGCIYFFTTELYATLIKQWYLRLLLACAVAFGGAHHEIIGNITNLHSYFSLVGVHVLVYLYASQLIVTSRIKKLLISATLFLITLSCPYFLTFLPLFWWKLFDKHTDQFKKVLIGVVTLGCVCQAISYLRFTQLVLPKISDQTVNFQSNLGFVINHEPSKLPGMLADTGIVINKKLLIQNFVSVRIIGALVRRNLEWVLTVYSLAAVGAYWFIAKDKKMIGILLLSIIFFLSQFLIFRPAMINWIAQDTFTGTFSGRYFFLPYAILLLTGAVVVSQARKKYLFILLVFVFQVYAGHDYWQVRFPEFDDQWWSKAGELRQLPSGEKKLIMINPVGWGVELTKP